MRTVGLSATVGLVVTCTVVPLVAQDTADGPNITGAQSTASGPGLTLDSLLNIRISAASLHEQTGREAPASITVLTHTDIQRYGYRTVVEALSSLRGFYTSSNRAFDGLGVRGFGQPSDYNNRILVMIDGVRQNTIFNGEIGLGTGFPIQLAIVDRIEVVRGPGSALYGGSAMFTVVNVVTRDPSGRPGGAVIADAGSFGLRSGSATYTRELGGRSSVLLHGSWQDTEGARLYFPEFDTPQTNNGIVESADGDESYTWLGQLKWRNVTLKLHGVQHNTEDPTAPYGSIFGSEPGSRRTSNVTASASWRHTWSPKVQMSGTSRFLTTRIDGVYRYDDPIGDRHAVLDGTLFESEAHLTYDPVPSSRVLFGVAHRLVDPSIRVGDGSQFRAPASETETVLSAFAQNEWQASPKISVVAGARVDHYSLAGSALSPRGAIVFYASRSTTLKALYGEAFRAPTPLEQFVDEPGIIAANPSLRPERIRTAEIVWEQRLTPDVYATLSVFDYRMHDLIAQAFDPATRLLTYQNLRHVHAKGGSAGARAQLGRHTSVFGNWTYQRTRDLDTGSVSVNSPSYLLRAGVATRGVFGSRVSAAIQHDSSRRSVRGVRIDGFTLANLTLTSPRHRGGTVSLVVRNLFDAAYAVPAGAEHRQVSIPQDGRTVRVRVSVLF